MVCWEIIVYVQFTPHDVNQLDRRVESCRTVWTGYQETYASYCTSELHVSR